MARSLQDAYAPRATCFGCGPANLDGLGLKSEVRGELVVASWTSEERHHAFPGVLCGGVIGTLLDCHSNWTAAWSYMRARGEERLGVTVTSEYTVRLLRPTPVGRELRLEARATAVEGRRITVESELSAEGRVTATCKGVFIAVKDDHPAASGW